MSALDKLFNPAQRKRLTAAIPIRVSCRAYTGAPSTADWASLSYAAERYRLPGARLALCRVEEALFTGTILGMGRITGCTAAAAVIVSSSEPLSRLHAGILGEAFALEATSLGLGTCWVSGTYRKRMLTPALKDNEAVLCIIAVGIPAPDSMNPSDRKRKPVERIVKGYDRWPATFRDVAKAVQVAPSAMNMQPWQLALDGRRFILDGSDRSQLDLGIALCHAELALPPHGPWQFGSSRGEPLCWTEVRT
ncbi:MAG: nitroreductase family protein [Christensenellaceae bacterium]|nr:nitroreductase family protein [Christensenellaceae bacterium]